MTHRTRVPHRRLLLATLALTHPAPAALWTNPAGGSWSDPSNWSPVGVPTGNADFNLAAVAPDYAAYPGYTLLLPANIPPSPYIRVKTDKVTFSQPAGSTVNNIYIDLGTAASDRSTATFAGGTFRNFISPSFATAGTSSLTISPNTTALSTTLSTGSSTWLTPMSSTINVAGPGAKLGVDFLRVSYSVGTTTVNVTGGGSLVGNSSPFPSSFVPGTLSVGGWGGAEPGKDFSAATINVDGPGSTLQFRNVLVGPEITPGHPVVANLNLTNGAVGEAQNTLGVGGLNTTATMLLDGPTTQFTAKSFVGIGGPSATLNITNGAKLVAPDADTSIAPSGGIGAFSLSGGATATTRGLTVGSGGNGTKPGAATVNVSSGSSLSTTSLLIGEQITGTPASLANYVHGQVTVGSTIPAISSLTASSSISIGYGHLQIDPGGQVTVNSTLSVRRYGTLNLRGGTLDAGTRSIQLNSGSTLAGFGTINASSVDALGAITPDGILHLNSNLSATSSSQLFFDITSPSTYDRLTGIKFLTFGGTLTVTAAPSFNPSMHDSFHLLDFTPVPGSTRTFSTLNLPPLPAPLYWDTSALYTTGTLTVLPEPSTLAMISAPLLLPSPRRRHRHRHPEKI